MTDYDRVITTLEQRMNTTWEQGERIAADERYTPDHKRGQVEALFTTSREGIAAEVDQHLQDIDQRLPEATRGAYVPIAPPAEQAAAHQYTRDALTERLRTGGVFQAESLWNAALDGRDLVTARVLADFFPAMWREMQTAQRDVGRGLDADMRGGTGGYTSPLPGWYADLHTRTYDALRTPDQRRAYEQATRMENARKTLKGLRVKADQELGNTFRLQGNTLQRNSVLKPTNY